MADLAVHSLRLRVPPADARRAVPTTDDLAPTPPSAVPPSALPDLIPVLESDQAGCSPRFYWSAAAGDEVLAGFGAAQVVVAAGADRLNRVGRACAEVRRNLVVCGDDTAAAPVRWLGGFAFDTTAPVPVSTADPVGPVDPLWEGYPSAQFTLPEVLVVARPDGCWLLLAGPADRSDGLEARGRELARALTNPSAGLLTSPATVPQVPLGRHVVLQGGASPVPAVEPDRALVARIASALEAIERGEVLKVVLATARTLDLSAASDSGEAHDGAELHDLGVADGFDAVYDLAAPPDPVELLARLRRGQPGCCHFLISPRPGLAFLGATPERLVRLTGDRLLTMALAGSAPREPDPEVDRQLGEALLASAKNRAEHELVVAAIRDALADYHLLAPGTPRLRRLSTIQHLETPIEARLSEQTDVLALASRLHPTPALGGVPRAAALELIRRLEGIDRGWYGGAVGWIDGRGDGELVVAIRSLLVRSGMVTAFAGAGIVAGSDPEAEAREIELKLQVALSALDGG